MQPKSISAVLRQASVARKYARLADRRGLPCASGEASRPWRV